MNSFSWYHLNDFQKDLRVLIIIILCKIFFKHSLVYDHIKNADTNSFDYYFANVYNNLNEGILNMKFICDLYMKNPMKNIENVEYHKEIQLKVIFYIIHLFSM